MHNRFVKNIRRFFFSAIILVVLAASSGLTAPPNKIQISGLSPSSGERGSTVTINGSGFSATASRVLFSGSSGSVGAQIISASSNTLVVTVPATAVSGRVYVQVNNWKSNSAQFTVESASNQAPAVNAGPDQTITLGTPANLNGTASDDGLPNGSLQTSWTTVSGPTAATFANPNSLNTTGTFSAAGTYTLRLTANDSALSASDDVVIVVNQYGTGVTYHVAPYGSDANAGISATAPWRTINKANLTLVAGDTVNIAGGTYIETINPVASGTANARITYQGVPGQTVTLTGVSQCISLTNRAYITIDRINCEQTLSSYATLNNSHHIWIANSRFDNCKNQNGWQEGILIYNNSHHNWIHDNSIRRVGYATATSSVGGAMRIGHCCANGDTSYYNLIERNELSYGGHHVLQIKTSYNVIRDNYFHNEEWMVWPDHPGTLAGHRLIIVEGGDVSPSNVQYNVIERNTLAFSGRPSDNSGTNGVSIRAPNNLVRQNLFIDNDLAGLNVSTFAWPSDARFTRVYHNTFFHNGYSVAPAYKPFQAGLSLVRYDTAALLITDVVIKNNIFWRNNWNQAITFESVASSSQVIGRNWMEAGDPRFVNATAPLDPWNLHLLDLRLREDSPCVNAGEFLTQTTTSGSGRAIRVADAALFTDGFGIVEGDLIQFEGSTTKLRVLGVDRINGILNVDRDSSWFSGQGVTLAYSESAPDLGAYELIRF